MPDGDKYHSKLSWRYQESYRELCERKCDRSEIVWTLKKALLLDIKKSYGVQPVKHAKRLGKILQGAMENAGKNSSMDWATLSKEIHRQVRQAELTAVFMYLNHIYRRGTAMLCPYRVVYLPENSCKYYEEELLLRSCKGIIHEFRYNQRVDTSNLPVVVVERLFQEIYKSNFEERIPLTSNHYAGLDRITVMECVEAINPDILAEISKWAKKATLDEDVKNLRRSPRQKVKEIDLEENLL
ncbi:MAG: hypothetical protein V7K97_21175 [Nostoc sp.]|uniref:hypothetical protein n=1 Tax=Nostoc sp. TaxID=1180 RepID=UPI002FF58C1E